MLDDFGFKETTKRRAVMRQCRLQPISRAWSFAGVFLQLRNGSSSSSISSGSSGSSGSLKIFCFVAPHARGFELLRTDDIEIE